MLIAKHWQQLHIIAGKGGVGVKVPLATLTQHNHCSLLAAPGHLNTTQPTTEDPVTAAHSSKHSRPPPFLQYLNTHNTHSSGPEETRQALTLQSGGRGQLSKLL